MNNNYYWNDESKIPSQVKRIRRNMKGKGILYDEFLGIYDTIKPGITLKQSLQNFAIEAGFLKSPEVQKSLFQNIDIYEIRMDEEHPYFECVKYAIGFPVEYIQLKIGEYSAKLTFIGGKFSTRGKVFNMIDGIFKFVKTLSYIETEGWDKDEQIYSSGKLLECYSQEYFAKIAKLNK